MIESKLGESIISLLRHRSKGGKKSSTTSKKANVASLRSKMFRKYRPPPKTLQPSTSSLPREPLPTKIANILENSRYQKSKSVISPSDAKAPTANDDADDSSSSDDDGLVNPADLDFSQITKSVSNANNSKDAVPSFDCNAGMRLSDSSDDEEENNCQTADPAKHQLVDHVKEKSSHEVRDFSDFHAFQNNFESAKNHLKKLCDDQKTLSSSKTSPTKGDHSDVTKLLSLGEAQPSTSNATANPRKRQKNRNDSDDSDWENVSGNKRTKSN